MLWPAATDQSTDALDTLKIMVTIALIATAVLIAALGVAHSILGEKYIIRWLLAHDLPRFFGGASFAGGTIRFAWHITTVLFLGLAAALVALALDSDRRAIVVIIGCTFIVSAALPIWFTRGRHLSWVVLLAAGAICLGVAAVV